MAMTQLDVKALVYTHERHTTIGRWTLDHMWFPAESDSGRNSMVVCFGGKKYGYIRSMYTESTDRPNLLYLQDNLGDDGSNLWWMAYRGDFSVAEAYRALIEGYIEESGVEITDVCFLGNCIGAFGALYFSFMLGGGTAIAVCPMIAIGSVYHGLPMLEWIVGDSGIDLDEHIFDHFNRHSNVRSYMFTGHNDKIVMMSKFQKFIALLIERENLFSLHNVHIAHGSEIKVHSAISYAINGAVMLAEAQHPLEYTCVLKKQK